MTNKEALCIIKFQMEEVCMSCGTLKYGGSESCDFCDTREAFNIAINAIEKQIQKKPKIELYTNRIPSEQTVYICPTCGEDFNGNEYKMDVCCDCGQSIDWSEEDE